MGEKIAKLGIKRDNDMMYYIKTGDVWATPRKKPGQPKGKAAKVAAAGIEMDYSKYLYYLDGDGDVARKERQVGGTQAREEGRCAQEGEGAEGQGRREEVVREEGRREEEWWQEGQAQVTRAVTDWTTDKGLVIRRALRRFGAAAAARGLFGTPRDTSQEGGRPRSPARILL